MSSQHADPPARPLSDRTIKEFKEAGCVPTCRACGVALKVGDMVDFQYPHDSTANRCQACNGNGERRAELPPDVSAPDELTATPVVPIAPQGDRPKWSPEAAPEKAHDPYLTAADLGLLAVGFPPRCPVVTFARGEFRAVVWGGLARMTRHGAGFLPSVDGELYGLLFADSQPHAAARGLAKPAPGGVGECPPLGVTRAASAVLPVADVAAIEVEAGDVVLHADGFLNRVRGRRLVYARREHRPGIADVEMVILTLADGREVRFFPLDPVTVAQFGGV